MATKKQPNRHKGLVTVELPKELWERLDDAARKRYILPTQLVRMILARVVENEDLIGKLFAA